MTSIALLIPIALGMGLIGLCAFFWALRRGSSWIWTGRPRAS
jgi:cbb3-type cytochrome oxidase maturation protein